MENQYENINMNFNNKFGSLLNKYIPKIEDVKKQIKKPEYEYQALCKIYAPIYGKRVYSLPYEKWYTDYKINEAHKQCIKYNQVGNVKYLIAVMRKM